MDLIGKGRSLEPRATRDLLDGDYGRPAGGSPELIPCCAEQAIPSSAKVAAWHLLNAESGTIGERRLFALVDAVACVVAHEGRAETARRAFECVVGSSAALAAVHALVGDG